MMFNNRIKSNISVDVLYDDIKRLRDDMREQWRVFEELRKKVNGLYTKDVRDTERPKVDILHDDVDNEVWTEIHLLRSRIIELEKNNK